MLRAHLLAPTFLALAACATAPAKKEPGPLTKRATFDLNCPASELFARNIDEITIGVHGCGKRAVYVEVCQRIRPYEDPECTWLRQGEILADEPRPE